MRYSKLMLATVLAALGTHMAGATPTAEEAAQLGKTLTPLGAIKAGNKEGTIPEWTGGVCTPPAGYKPIKGLEVGGGPYVDPYAADKPLFKITSANLAQYADKIDAGTKELFRVHPEFYINVYPTHRSACYANYVYENTIKNVMKPRIVGGEVPALTGAWAQVPFPIPKTGVEAMWNNAVSPTAPYVHFINSNTLVDSSGKQTLIGLDDGYTLNLYWDNNLPPISEDKAYWGSFSLGTFPAGHAGTMTLLTEFLRPDLQGARAWTYIVGQRRVRAAPEFAYDGAIMSSGGITLYDEILGFHGKMDKYDFKLTGRKEMYLPYNTYAFQNAPTKDVATPNFINPELMRYELHRFWEVVATLKPGERHVHKQKVFYIDEDSWNILASIGTDQAGKIHHLDYQASLQLYDFPMIRASTAILYDFSKRAYLIQTKATGLAQNGTMLFGVAKDKPFKPSLMTPEGMAAQGLR